MPAVDRPDAKKDIHNSDLLNGLNTQEVIELIELCKAKLRHDGVIRTDNLLGDYTEFLVARNLGLTLQSSSKSGFDAVDATGKRYQIKGRRISSNKSIPHIKRFENFDFDYFVLVVFNRDFSIYQAGIITKEDLEEWIKVKSGKGSTSLNVTKEFLNSHNFKGVSLKKN